MVAVNFRPSWEDAATCLLPAESVLTVTFSDVMMALQ